MRTIELANLLTRRFRLSRAAGCTTAWRILNEYPEELREAAVQLAKGETPTVTVRDLTVEEIAAMTGAGPLEALELMYVLTADKSAGETLLLRLSRHDNGKN